MAYTTRTNPYISGTQGFLDAYQRGISLALQKRQLDIQERRSATYDRYMEAQIGLLGRKQEKYPWKRFTADVPGGLKGQFEQHEFTGKTRPLEGFEPTLRNVEKGPFTEAYNLKGFGELETGSPSSMLGIPLPTLTQESQHIAYATKRWGPSWRTVAPEAAEIIKEKFPEGKLAKNLFAEEPKTGRGKQLFVPEGIEDLWDTMNETERKKARRYLKAGGDVEEIRRILLGG